jgi:hypothetical protein
MKNSALTSLRFSIDIRGVAYRFTNVTSTEYNDPLEKDLRASPQGFGDGVIEESNITSSVTLTRELYEIPSALLTTLYDVWLNNERVLYKEFSSNTSESMAGSQAIISTNPRNGTKGDGSAESVNLVLKVTRNNLVNQDV